ncbi:MAG: MFS transporter [Candidatus Hydrothermales bacterium]
MKNSQKHVLYFIILLGLISLFSDMTYEGARSITGPFLAFLGASAAIVGFTAGFGEFIGYALRLISGIVLDKTKKFWLILFIGYVVNLFAVPALALVECWQWAVFFILAERLGKAIRTPVRDTMLSYATFQIGRGLGFGIHEALDQIGAVTGPLIIALVFYFKGSYKEAFGVLLVPALVALSILIVAKRLYPAPEKLEIKTLQLEKGGFSKIFWFYLIGIALWGAGYADFALIAYHFKKTFVVSEEWIPIFYAIAMGVDAISALILGYLFDKKGLKILLITIVISIGFVPLVFLGNFYSCILGMVLWGIGLGTQESIVRATISLLVPKEKRGSGYGVFNTGFGLAWFIGSFILGILYDISIPSMILFSIGIQLLATLFIIQVLLSFK